jgi:glutathione S-transferase
VAYEQIPELAERGRQQVVTFFERLEQQLEENDYIAGDYFSITDITALVLVDFAAWIKISTLDSAVNLKRWYDAVSSRPSATA